MLAASRGLASLATWTRRSRSPGTDRSKPRSAAPAAVEEPEKLTKAKAMVTALNSGSVYWHGLTKEGKPILWIRTNRKPWYPDVDAEVNALILLADEPTGNLDPATSVGIMRILDRINRTGTTVIMATHDREMVDSMRRRVIALEDGKVIRDQSRGVYGYGD